MLIRLYFNVVPGLEDLFCNFDLLSAKDRQDFQEIAALLMS